MRVAEGCVLFGWLVLKIFCFKTAVLVGNVFKGVFNISLGKTSHLATSVLIST